MVCAKNRNPSMWETRTRSFYVSNVILRTLCRRMVPGYQHPWHWRSSPKYSNFITIHDLKLWNHFVVEEMNHDIRIHRWLNTNLPLVDMVSWYWFQTIEWLLWPMYIKRTQAVWTLVKKISSHPHPWYTGMGYYIFVFRFNIQFSEI